MLCSMGTAGRRGGKRRLRDAKNPATTIATATTLSRVRTLPRLVIDASRGGSLPRFRERMLAPMIDLRGIRGALALAAILLAAAAAQDDGWRSFGGSWSAVGHREAVPTEGNRPASIVALSGSLVITSGEGPRRGFRAEVIGFDDGSGVRAGRAVWTDDRGDRIYSALEGDPLRRGGRVTGRITGGSGRYAGIAGEYAFTWQYVVDADTGEVSGRTTDLAGRYRLAGAAR
jgi:hypothetical protein